MKLPPNTRTALAAGALLLAGFGGGAVLAATSSADAASDAPGSSRTSAHGRSDETPLTGTTAAKVKAAALATYPGATVDRVETDSDGVYEAHLTTKAGDRVTVQVDRSFSVTGTQTGDGHGGPRGHDDSDRTPTASGSTAG